MFARCSAPWCRLRARYLSVLPGAGCLVVCKVRGGLVFGKCEVAWCSIGETWLGVC